MFVSTFDYVETNVRDFHPGTLSSSSKDPELTQKSVCLLVINTLDVKQYLEPRHWPYPVTALTFVMKANGLFSFSVFLSECVGRVFLFRVIEPLLSPGRFYFDNLYDRLFRLS